MRGDWRCATKQLARLRALLTDVLEAELRQVVFFDTPNLRLSRAGVVVLFSHHQRSLYKRHAPRGLDLDSLMPCGPINLAKLKFALEKHAAVAELGFYPDRSRVLELSMKCAAHKAVRVAAKARAFLSSRGIQPSDEQQRKTDKALLYFSRLGVSVGIHRTKPRAV